MTRYDTTARRAAAAAAVLAVTGLAVAGCKSSTSAAGSSTTPAAASSSPAAAASAGSSASSAAGAQAATFFPVGVNNTWVYASTVGGKTATDITNKMIAVDPVTGGQQVTMSVTPATGSATTVTYLFHSDGSITVPVSEFGNGTLKITSGQIVWPTKAELASGQPHTSALTFSVAADGKVSNVTVHVTIAGGGMQSVTVPAGTYQAQLINEDFTETLLGQPVKFTLQTWVASGVGPVKVALAPSSSNSLDASVQVLKSFTKGS
jgi:hypothetical protein